MGLLKDALGPAFGAGQVNNGMNGPLSKFKKGFSSNTNNSYPSEPSYPSSEYYNQDSRYRQRGTRGPTYPNQNSRGVFPFSDAPPRYSSHEDRNELWEAGYDQSRSQYNQNLKYGSSVYPQPPPSSDRMQDPDFRPFALPQVAHGDGKPFLRGYSNELRRYGIPEADFIKLVDSINVAIIPNPENQIFQQAAQIAGYFVPGVDGIAISASQIVVGLGASMTGSLGKKLSQANLNLFIPNGLEICIGKIQNVDQEAGFSPPSQGFQGTVDPQSRLDQYGDYLMPLTALYPQQQKIGRQDPIAMMGRGMSAKNAQRSSNRAMKERDRGRRTKKGDGLEAGLQWLIVRKAHPNSTAQWQQTLQRADAASAQGQTRVGGGSRR